MEVWREGERERGREGVGRERKVREGRVEGEGGGGGGRERPAIPINFRRLSRTLECCIISLTPPTTTISTYSIPLSDL
jgi:hypothetical protein